MTKLKFFRKYAGTGFAFFVLIVAQIASTQYSYIFYQDSVPEAVKKLKKI